VIAAVAVVGRDDAELGQVPVAYVVLRAVAGDDGVDRGPTRLQAREVADRIKKTLERDLVRAKRPVALCVVERMPAGPTGKVKRRLLDTSEAPVLFSFDLR
jgi:fatty-acyl-CoA synthase